MSDLVEFLTARLDEDEEWAQQSTLDGRRYDRERVLREVEAGRKILAEYAAVLKLIELTDADRSALGYREWTVRHLAAVYSDHPDYDEAWRQ